MEINQYDITMVTHYDITMGNDVARDIHCDVTMSNDIAMCTYHGITMHVTRVMTLLCVDLHIMASQCIMTLL